MKKTSTLQTILTVLFVSCMLISNIITAKQVQLPFGIVMTGGIMVFPMTYVLSDVFSECYGYRWSRITCYLAFAMNLLSVIIFTVAINTPAPSFWSGQEAFQMTLGNTPRILFASLAAFVLGDWVNDSIFSIMKAQHRDELKGFGCRAIVSSVAGEIVDSLIFFPIAFLGQMPVDVLFQMGLLEVVIKVGYEVVILPLTTQVVKVVNELESE